MPEHPWNQGRDGTRGTVGQSAGAGRTSGQCKVPFNFSSRTVSVLSFCSLLLVLFYCCFSPFHKEFWLTELGHPVCLELTRIISFTTSGVTSTRPKSCWKDSLSHNIFSSKLLSAAPGLRGNLEQAPSLSECQFSHFLREFMGWFCGHSACEMSGTKCANSRCSNNVAWIWDQGSSNHKLLWSPARPWALSWEESDEQGGMALGCGGSGKGVAALGKSPPGEATF